MITGNGSAVNGIEGYHTFIQNFDYTKQSSMKQIKDNDSESWYICFDGKDLYATGNDPGCSDLPEARIGSHKGIRSTT